MEGGNMTQESVWQYAAVKRGDYLCADRKGKKRILDEFCRTTGYHRKSAIRLLRHPPKEQRKTLDIINPASYRPTYGLTAEIMLS
jgi:hypothetical protein